MGGLALVKWWLLAMPHYVVVVFFMGGNQRGGLITILAFFSAVANLFTAKYPEDLFKLVVGLNRWSIKVFAYASLMTDEYPPLRRRGAD